MPIEFIRAAVRSQHPDDQPHYCHDLLPWNGSLPQFAIRGIPWPRLGTQSSEWRRRLTIGVISVNPSVHLATLAIFGPQRIVIPFDSAGGAHDSKFLKAVSYFYF